MASSEDARTGAGAEGPVTLKDMQDANRDAAAEGRPGPHLSLDLDKPPPHKTGNMLERLFGRRQHPEYVKEAVRKLYHDPEPTATTRAAQRKLLAYTAAHTAPIQGMGGAVKDALALTPAPKSGWFKGTIPNAPKPWGDSSAAPQVQKGVILKNDGDEESLGGLISAIGDPYAKAHIENVFKSRFQKQKKTLDAADRAKRRAGAVDLAHVQSSINGGRRPRRTRRTKRHTRKATRNRKSRVRRSRRKRRTRRN